MAEILQTLEEYKEAYKEILAQTMAENAPYDKLVKKIDETFEKYGISDEKTLNAKLSALTSLLQTVTTSSQDIALRLLLASKELELTEKKLLLAQAELEFNKARAELVKTQKDSEEARKRAIEREIISYDDRLRIQEATLLKDSVFGYSVGGLTPPADMTTKMFDAIDKITP
ncbi:hypothetical protein [Campylobacter californiensis]|uniref:hypothetical protein n=1 Tax=Campylobacter californiensis TaxID=1032243 RepID=UPI001474F7E7|nr:hypothetical protein [Campylobacter sp. RM12916]MBE3610480.1 hypothetical protein [Campylobacter sp. RM12916]